MPYKFSFLLFLGVFLIAEPAAASRLYKWTDAQGQVHYSDRLPPDAAAREREVKSNRGLTLERVDAAKTRAQLDQEQQAREQEEARRQAESEIQRKQAASDRTLLLTFSTTDEIERARDDRVAAVDGQIGLTRTRIDNLQDKLQRTRQQAINAERTGRNPQDLHQRILDMEQQVASYENFIKSREQERAEIISQFNADLSRYQELKRSEAE
jgi:hypothetical protein